VTYSAAERGHDGEDRAGDPGPVPDKVPEKCHDGARDGVGRTAGLQERGAATGRAAGEHDCGCLLPVPPHARSLCAWHFVCRLCGAPSRLRCCSGTMMRHMRCRRRWACQSSSGAASCRYPTMRAPGSRGRRRWRAPARARGCVCVCVRACVRACMRASMRALKPGWCYVRCGR